MQSKVAWMPVAHSSCITHLGGRAHLKNYIFLSHKARTEPCTWDCILAIEKVTELSHTTKDTVGTIQALSQLIRRLSDQESAQSHPWKGLYFQKVLSTHGSPPFSTYYFKLVPLIPIPHQCFPMLSSHTKLGAQSTGSFCRLWDMPSRCMPGEGKHPEKF